MKEFIDEIRPQVSRASTGRPRDLGVNTNAEPLGGRAELGRVVAVLGGISLVLFLVLLIVLVALGHLGS